MNFYPFHIGDYISHTSHLTDKEDLAYRRMMDLYYMGEQPFPDDFAWVARRVRADSEIVGNLLNEYFELMDDGLWHNTRADKEIAKYQFVKESGKKGAEKRWSNREEKPIQSDANTPPIASPIATKTINQDQEPLPNIKAISMESKIPPCPHQQIIDIYHQVLPELPKVISWNKTREAHLKQRWRELFTEFECKSTDEALDWFRNDFFQFIKNSKFLTGKTQSKDRRPFLADLEWVIKPTNFTKIIERKYL